MCVMVCVEGVNEVLSRKKRTSLLRLVNSEFTGSKKPRVLFWDENKTVLHNFKIP